MTFSSSLLRVGMLMSVLILSVSIAAPADANCFGGGGSCGINLELSGAVIVNVSDNTITAGEPVYITWYGMMANSCEANFTYAPIENIYGGEVCDDVNNVCYTPDPAQYPAGGATTYPTATVTYTVTCLDSYSQYEAAPQYVTDSETVTVSPAVAADLIAGATTVSANPAPGVAATLTSSVTNYGGTDATSFPNIFQIENVGVVAAQTLTLTASGGANDSDPLSASYTFVSSGAYRVRACADNNTSWIGTVSETNEGNNCSVWTDVAVAPPAPECSDGQDNNSAGGSDYPNDSSCTSADDDTEDGVVASVSCTVDSANVTVGGQTTYHAVPANGAGAPYIWTPSSQTNCTGTVDRTCTFPTAGQYTMSVQATGATNPATCPTVTAGCSGPVSVSITADGENDDVRVEDGSSVSIAWIVSGTSSACTVSGTDGYSSNFTPTTCNVSDSVSRTVTTQTIYTLTCGGTNDTVIVNVGTNLEEF
ncbi:MAG: CARDB domain-containing protein [Patescibacteria group bacterium]